MAENLRLFLSGYVAVNQVYVCEIEMSGLTALVCNKKGSDGRKITGYDLGWVNRNRLTAFSSLMSSILSSQLDYTKAGTCDKCYEKRNNVSKAAESCTCTVVFPIKKAFKVTLSQTYGPRVKIILFSWQTGSNMPIFQCSSFLSKPA